MNCRELCEFICDYLGGELPERERAIFEEHLRLCPPCVTFLKTYEKTIKLEKACTEMDTADLPALPEALVQAILRARGESSGGCGAGK